MSALVRVLAAATLAGAAVAAPVASAGGVPALAGENVVTASAPSRMTVRIPTAARISVDPAKSVSIQGSGRLVGLILREHREEMPDDATFLRLPSQLGSRVFAWGTTAPSAGSCTTPVPKPAPPMYQDCTGIKPPTYFSLHRGLYSLYVLTDGAPLTVTVHVLNLPGSVELAPGTRVGGATMPLQTSFDPGAAGVTWSGGAGLRPTRAADLFTVTWWKQDDSAAADNGACWYDGDGVAALGDKRWVPGCPGGSSVEMTEVTNPLYGPSWLAKGGQHGGLGWTSVPSATTVGLGWWTVAQGVRDVGGLAVWLGH